MRQLREALRELVEVESPSSEALAVERCADRLAEIGRTLTGFEPQRIPLEAGTPGALTWRFGEPADARRVLLLGHVDTVWPLGTLADWPITDTGDRMSGPGVFDMKAGLLVALFALARIGADAPLTFLVTSDEEIGSAASRSLIEAEARQAQAVLVLEGAGPGGTLKSARKGWSIYQVRLRGKAAHAGLEPDKGRNALVCLAELVQSAATLSRPATGLTVTPTLAKAGTTVNTVPAQAEFSLDVRASTADDQQTIDAAIRRLGSADRGGVRVDVDGGVNRPPMEPTAAGSLLRRAEACAGQLGLPCPGAVTVGGISDANLTAALGIPTLDGLGAVGGGAHAAGEWVDIPATVERIDLLTALVTDLVEHPEVGRHD
ncbi:zinc-binding metallopeptidase family protein [Flindersiella endophytica]